LDKHKILLTGGGTAGHVMPNLALVPMLEERGAEVFYIGSINGIEKELVADKDIKYYPISSGKLRRYFSWQNFTDPFRILRGYFQARKIIKKEAPNAVFSKGGFVTVPVVFAAKSLGIPVVLHESDYTPGLANRLAIPKAERVCVSFESTAKHIPEGKCVVTGAPVRSELLSGDRQRGLDFLGFSGEKPVLLIMGGSLGAQAVNDAVDSAIDELTAKYDIAHIRGAGKLNPEINNGGYKQFEYISEELADVFAASDLMLSRAGAGAIFEILSLGLPALLVPLPKEASRGDQILNSNYFKNKGYSLVLAQSDITPETLVASIDELHARSAELKANMKASGFTNGTTGIIETIYSVLENK